MFYRYSGAGVFLIIGMLSMCISWSDACTCVPSTRRQQCRNADFSFIGRPFFAGTTGPGPSASNRYCFVIERVIKGFLNVVFDPCVYSPIQSSLCGIGFQNFEKYVVNGFRGNGRNQVNLCGWNERWADVPNVVKFRYLTRPQFCIRDS